MNGIPDVVVLLHTLKFRIQIVEHPEAEEDVHGELGLHDEQVSVRDEHVHEVHVDLAQPSPVFGVEAEQVGQEPVKGSTLDALHAVLAGCFVVFDGGLERDWDGYYYSQGIFNCFSWLL